MANMDDEDMAPEQGLMQCFPVVAPLSDKQLGPQDVMTPSDVWSQIRDKELTDDTWRFKRDRAQAALEREQGLATKLRHRAELAERDVHCASRTASAQLIEVERSADERCRRAAEAVLEKRMRLQEVQKLRDDAAHAARERVAEATALLENERQHTAEVEELLLRRRESAAAAWRQNEELEAQSEARLASCEKEVITSEKDAKLRLEAAKAKVQEQIDQAQARSQEDLRAARARLAACDASCKYRLDFEAQRKEQCDAALQKRKTEAVARLEIDQFIMQRHLSTMKEDCAAHVQHVAKRELATAMDVEKKVGVLSDFLGASAKRSAMTHDRDQQSIDSLGQAVYTLGNDISARQQYNMRIDDKLSACLQGHLHGMPGIAAPSPRSLPPPAK